MTLERDVARLIHLFPVVSLLSLLFPFKAVAVLSGVVPSPPIRRFADSRIRGFADRHLLTFSLAYTKRPLKPNGEIPENGKIPELFVAALL